VAVQRLWRPCLLLIQAKVAAGQRLEVRVCRVPRSLPCSTELQGFHSFRVSGISTCEHTPLNDTKVCSATHIVEYMMKNFNAYKAMRLSE
jgi:hypothetical protein